MNLFDMVPQLTRLIYLRRHHNLCDKSPRNHHTFQYFIMRSFFYHQFLLLVLSLGSLATSTIDPPPDEASSSQNLPIENGTRNLMSTSIGRTMNEPRIESEGCLPSSTSNQLGRSKNRARRGAVCKVTM